jgi:hypothetical protein
LCSVKEKLCRILCHKAGKSMFLTKGRQVNARNIKGRPKNKNELHATNHGTIRNDGKNPHHHQQPPQTADLVAMATCYFSWAINMFFLHGFAGSKLTLKS